jgi:hypothetical protein
MALITSKRPHSNKWPIMCIYEALDVYEQYSLKILGVTHILNLVYATTIAIVSQVAL